MALVHPVPRCWPPLAPVNIGFRVLAHCCGIRRILRACRARVRVVRANVFVHVHVLMDSRAVQACIYEWLERSQTCPFCSRKMEFEEIEQL